MNRFVTRIIVVLLASFHMNVYSVVNYNPFEKELVNAVENVINFGGISVNTSASSSSGNSFDDGDNVSGFFGRLLEIVKATFRLIITGSMLIGLIMAIGGFALVREANKNKLSPRIGIITILVGIALGSPVACTRMAEYTVLDTDEATLMLESEISGNIQSNRE